MNLLIADLLAGYRSGRTTPGEVVESVLSGIEAAPERNVWITCLARHQVLGYVEALASKSPHELPLFGIPFAVKDNIDLAGVPTTAGCPEFAYVPQVSAPVVQRLVDVGAIPIGKTNLDQFATGLVGTRSPYGECRNAFDAKFISGGSSSGSAVAVATGCVSFALGTDTAGSGRVPAAFNNIVGLKPSCGLLSTRGVVPACRSLDCISIFALTCAEAQNVLGIVQGFDSDDPYSRQIALRSGRSAHAEPRVGVPDPKQLEFFGDTEYARLFAEACARLEQFGWTAVDIDLRPFLETARLLYEGPWVAERYAAIADFIAARPEALHSVTRQIIAGGANASAVDAFRAQYRLKALQRASASTWQAVDFMMLPTAGTIYSIDAVNADPIGTNANLGYYTNFVNLLDLAAVALPAGFRSDGLPFGVTLIAPAGHDEVLLDYAEQLHRASVAKLGALDLDHPADEPASAALIDGHIPVVVCGAHMKGLPLNHQLRERNAYFLRSARTAASYRFYALPGGPPHRPGLVRASEGGGAIETEIWAMPQEHFGSFIAGIPAPLGIGKIELENGERLPGFLCESYALDGAVEITALGSWRTYLSGSGKA